MWMLSIFFLSITAALCVVGTLHPRYDDNLLQRIGMSLLALSCVGRGAEAIAAQYVSMQSLLMHAAVTLLAAGTAIKYMKRGCK